MKAVVWHDVGKISVDEVPDPAIQDPTDAIVRITTSAICGTDLHFVRGTMPGMRPGTIFGAGPVGQLAALSARMQGAGRVLVVDGISDRLETARLQNAETIDFNADRSTRITAATQAMREA